MIVKYPTPTPLPYPHPSLVRWESSVSFYIDFENKAQKSSCLQLSKLAFVKDIESNAIVKIDFVYSSAYLVDSLQILVKIGIMIITIR